VTVTSSSRGAARFVFGSEVEIAFEHVLIVQSLIVRTVGHGFRLAWLKYEEKAGCCHYAVDAAEDEDELDSRPGAAKSRLYRNSGCWRKSRASMAACTRRRSAHAR
jgi:hypothetical protein